VLSVRQVPKVPLVLERKDHKVPRVLPVRRVRREPKVLPVRRVRKALLPQCRVLKVRKVLKV
jgi:hypothetical protein